MEAKDGDKSYVPRMVAGKKLGSVKIELKMVKEDYSGLMVGFQLTRKKLRRVRGESKNKDALTES